MNIFQKIRLMRNLALVIVCASIVATAFPAHSGALPAAPVTTPSAPQSPALRVPDTNITITPYRDSTPITLMDNDAVRLYEPAVISPDINSLSGVPEKVIYKIDNAIVYTSLQNPYSYQIDTKHIRNGSYTLTIDRQFSATSHKLTKIRLYINNALDIEQVYLFILHYWWQILILLIGTSYVLSLAWHRKYRKHLFVQNDQTGYIGSSNANSSPTGISENKEI